MIPRQEDLNQIKKCTNILQDKLQIGFLAVQTPFKSTFHNHVLFKQLPILVQVLDNWSKPAQGSDIALSHFDIADLMKIII